MYKFAKKEDAPGGEGGVYKYIGETAKSAYERGANHLYDRKNLDLGSHMLKHALEHHREEDPNEVKFHMKVLSYHKSSFERQINEAVKIQYNRENHILNSKAEYNRSSIPRLGVKMGGKSYKNKQDHADGDREEIEREIEEKIRMLRKKHGKKNQRRKYCDESSAPKRRKLGEEEYKELRRTSGDGEGEMTNTREKRSLEDPIESSKTVTGNAKKRKTQTVMEKYLKSMDVVVVEKCAVDGVTSESDVKHFANVGGGEMILSVQMCNNVKQADGEMSEMNHSVQECNIVKHADGVTSEMIQNVQMGVVDVDGGQSELTTDMQLSLKNVVGGKSDLDCVQKCNSGQQADGKMSEMNHVRQADGATREMIPSVQMIQNVQMVVVDVDGGQSDLTTDMQFNMRNMVGGKSDLVCVLKCNSEKQDDGEMSEMLPYTQMCDQAKHVDGATSEMIPEPKRDQAEQMSRAKLTREDEKPE